MYIDTEEEINQLKNKIETLEGKIENSQILSTQTSDNDNERDNILKILNLIKKRSFISMTFYILMVCSIILLVILGSLTNSNNIIFMRIAFFGIVSLLVSFGIVSLVINIVNAIKIFSTDFKNEYINSNKMIWGIFTIVFLGWIASLVFSTISINKLNSEINKK